MNYFVFFCGLVSMATTFFITPWLIKFLKKIGLEVKDQNKESLPLVPISGGLAVLVGIFAGLFVFTFGRTFFDNRAFHSIVSNSGTLALLFASMLSLFIVTIVGFLDDIIVNKSKERSSGLSQWQKPLLTLAAAVPLMVINAGDKSVALPFWGIVDFGWMYPLILIPIGVVGAANMVNLLAGFNGMEAGLGIIYMGMLGLYAYIHGIFLAALIALIVFCSLIAFYYYNKVPAKIFPGDSLTYLLGGALAVIAIVGNMEKAALICSIPFFIEFFLKLRSKFKAQTYGYEKDGKIHSRYNKIYSIPHIFTITGRFTEKQVVYFMFAIELFFSSLIWIV